MLRQILHGHIANHPIHPLLTHFPIGVWVASFISDICYFASGNAVFAAISRYCILLGIIGAVLAAVFGAIEFLFIGKESRAKTIAIAHMVLNVIALVFFVISFAIRVPAPLVVPAAAFILSVIGICALGAAGYLGGVMVYDYGIGMQPIHRDQRPPEKIKRVA